MDRLLDSIGRAYDHGIRAPGKETHFLVLVAFLLSFGFIRTSAHLIRAEVRWWPGNVKTSGGTHVHHLVWGILLLLVCGYVGIAIAPESPWRQLVAVLFGVGMGLTLDEFALWLDLKDVYWLPDGRKSIDAVIVTAAAGALLLLGVRIWVDLAHETETVLELLVTGSASFGVLLAALNALKGRYAAAAVSLVVPVVGLVLLVALPGRPTSIWHRVLDRRRHSEPAARQARRAP